MLEVALLIVVDNTQLIIIIQCFSVSLLELY